MCPWLPFDFFNNLEGPVNAIILNPEAHRLHGAFRWFVKIDEINELYRVGQVKDDGLLNKLYLLTDDRATGRYRIQNHDGDKFLVLESSFDQPLFIGKAQPQPGKAHVCLRELVARVFYSMQEQNA